MAVYQSDQVRLNGPRSVHGDARESQRAMVYVNTTAALATNDTIQLCYLPPNGVVTGANLVAATQLDTNGTPLLAMNVGDNGYGVNGQTGYVAPDTSRYFTATTVGRTAAGTDANANGTINGRARLFKNTSTANLLVFATVTAGAATGAAGTLAFEFTYFIDEPQSLLNV